jgi:hypothetical protein
MSTADTLICSIELGTDQLVREARQFDAVVRDTKARAEVAELLVDTIVALVAIGESLDPDIDFQPQHIKAHAS